MIVALAGAMSVGRWGFLEVPFISEGVEISYDVTKRQFVQLSIKSSKPLSSDDKTRIENWFKARAKTDAVVVIFASEVQTSKKQKGGRIGRAKS
jgi:hypothetical protein